MSEDDFLEIHLSKKHLAAIGLVTVRWSILESTVEQCLWGYSISQMTEREP